MNRKQIYALVGMGIVFILILGGIWIAINTNHDLNQSRAEFQTTLDALKQASDATITAQSSR